MYTLKLCMKIPCEVLIIYLYSSWRNLGRDFKNISLLVHGGRECVVVSRVRIFLNIF